jgi:hypothetical protein
MYLLHIAGILLTLELTGCAHEIALKGVNDHVLGKAIIQFEASSSGVITLEKNDVIYRGPWSAKKIDESGRIAGIFGINSKKYKDYSGGRGNYLRLGKSVLQSEHGEIINCEFKYRGIAVQGTCKSEKETFEFVNK